jgi:hypothetical protein
MGSGPALEHQNRPHFSGGGNDILCPYRFFDTEKYAYRLRAASRPTRPNLGRIGRVSFKQS